MWTCPKCKQKFLNANQWHSCGENTVENFLHNKNDVVIELYHYLIAEFKKIGDFELHPAKTRIALNKKMRFASINRLGKDFLDAHLVFPEKHDSTLCFHKIDEVTKTAYVHHFKLHSKNDLTSELKKYMKVAHEIGSTGTKEYLKKKT